MAKSIRDVYGASLLKYGAPNKKVVVLDADVSSSTKSGVFGKECPERFFNCGIAEYNMMGMAAGFASCGYIPVVNTFTAFLSTIGALPAKAFLSYSKLNVKMAGGYSGMSDAYDGPSHHALEDMAIMRAMPNITLLVASDEACTDWMVKTALEVEGPMYLRLSRDTAEDCHPEGAKFEIGKGMVCKDGKDVTIIACGVLVSKSMEAAKMLEQEGISVRVVDMYSVKPIDKQLIIDCCKETGAIVTAEEHNVLGGLGSAVAEVMVLNECNVPVEMVGLQDTHAETGSYKDLFAKYGLDANGVAAAVKRVLAKKNK